MNIRALIFDMDGVLADTPPLHYESWKRLAQDEGINFGWEQHEQMQGLVRRHSLDVFLGGKLITESQAQEMMARKNTYFTESLQKLTPADRFPGTAEIMQEAHEAGIKVGLGSSSQNAREVIKKLGLAPYFDVVADGYTVRQNKPAPDIFLWVADQLKVTPSEAIVFEDSVAGMQAAIAGGFWRVGLGGKHGDGAHVALNSLAEVNLAGLLQRLNEVAAHQNGTSH
ncbi:MAG: beta-phosphoglucomutase [Anaerolineaceae bacterium]|nr:beta-phosphoglucomutase [Anaerolineaceae bacterium]